MYATTVILILSAIAFNASDGYDMVLGDRVMFDELLYKEQHYKIGLPLIVRVTQIEFPAPDIQDYAYVSAIRVIDNNKGTHGAYPSLIGGGIHQKFAIIDLRSDRGWGFNFTVSIYGIKTNIG